MHKLLRYAAAVGAAILIAVLCKRIGVSQFVAGWWAGCAWLIITEQWQPFKKDGE